MTFEYEFSDLTPAGLARRVDEPRMVDRADIRPLDMVNEGEWVVCLHSWVGVGQWQEALVCPVRVQCHEQLALDGAPSACLLEQRQGDGRTVKIEDLPPKLVRGVVPPIDCRTHPCELASSPPDPKEIT